MLRKFRIKINNKEYLVEMEELTPQAVTQSAPVQVAPAPAPTSTPAPAPVNVASQAAGEGVRVEAPMPGNILNVFVKVGDVVKENDPLVILEAMKMENEIVSPINGTITSVAVMKGVAIDVAELIVTIK